MERGYYSYRIHKTEHYPDSLRESKNVLNRMKLVKEITSVRNESVDGDALYFNPDIYDYAKKNSYYDIPLYELLRCLQDKELCDEYFYHELKENGWVYALEDKWNDDGIFEETWPEVSRANLDWRAYGRELLVMDIFGLSLDDAENYLDTGAGLADEVLFTTLSAFDEEKIKSPLDMKDVRLWDWKMETYPISKFTFDSLVGYWQIPPFIFGYAKSLTGNSLLMNWNELPWGGK